MLYSYSYSYSYSYIYTYIQVDDLQWELARRLYQEKCEPSITYEVYNPRVLIQKASELLPFVPFSEINTPDLSKTNTKDSKKIDKSMINNVYKIV